MLKRSLFIAAAFGLFVVADAGCKKQEESTAPEEVAEETPKKKGVSEDNEESMVAAAPTSSEGEGEAAPATTDMDAAVAKEDAKVKKPEVKEVCKTKTVGKGKAKKKETTCEMVDSNPKLSASIGVASLIKGFEWGMSPEQVLAKLGESINKYFDDQLKETKNPMDQDRIRKERNDQLNELKKGHIKFASSTKHKWGVSLIQYEFADDNNEEMIWVKEGSKLRKFYFFKDGQLWKIVYAFNKEKWPDKDYQGVVDNSFKKWFGVNPAAKVKQDPKTAAVLLRYNEWTGEKNEKVRSFDMTEVHGVIVVAVVDGTQEASIGERLPNIKGDDKFTDTVGDVLGTSDVAYDEKGNIIEGKNPAK
ncbi:hypothetical protein SAMN02745121_00110 [Nannocystis exedens]|uniref:Lipoprotein n=1 Tax=Nannocystis exedens TaxID=54 RepID=A0A1I1SW03_9BACT|nr:hypothetical protein [Nannocystis exedens]PCC75569.1 hypothetical protein NAEX_08681 [Nannocystis exedens]SFD47200.1 hypothetical protein SAMN02745121_00110 [Nannocystis exedens]